MAVSLTSKVKKCLFVVSHPRSGTHLLLDFIRRNFPAFNPRLPPWESAAKLYLRMDGPNWRSEILEFTSSHVLAQSHHVGFTSNSDAEVYETLKPEATIYLYPFRQFSRVVKSFAEFQNLAPPISAVLNQKDTFFNKTSSVAESIRAHALTWIERGAHFVDCDALLTDPEAACSRMATLLGEQPARVCQRLPRRKVLRGKPGELIERLSGRQSTEILVQRKLCWKDESERLYVDDQFHEVYSELAKRCINSSHLNG